VQAKFFEGAAVVDMAAFVFLDQKKEVKEEGE